jgi:phosphomannomutase/phosphoglucomutase
MRYDIESHVDYNSFDYFEKTLITDNGFREYDVRWLLAKEVNPNGFVVLGKAYGTYAREILKQDSVVVAHDFRSYSQNLCHSFLVGLLSTGVHVRDTGLKLAQGLSSTLGPEGVQQFKEVVKSGRYSIGAGTYESFDGMFDFYLKDILKAGKIRRPLKVVIAAGNGTAGRFAPEAVRQLGCELVELDCTPDWDFKKHNPNPEDLSFLESISKAAIENKADVAIGIDGDGDRVGVVDDLGRPIYSDKLGLLIARWMAPQEPGRGVVIDVKSTGLFNDDPVLRETHTEVHLCKTGHSYMKAKVSETNAIAGFEKSGHWFFNPPFGRGYDDALQSSVHLLRYLADSDRPFSQLIDELPQTWQSPTLGVECADDIKYKVVDDVTAQYEQDQKNGVKIGGHGITEVITVNGVRFILDDGSWGLVRASSNKPSLVVVAEARGSELELYDIVDHIRARLAQTGKVGEYDQEMPPRPNA